jgi:hypothetical protein
MTDDIVNTELSTGHRGRGRPVGTGYLRFDGDLVEEVRQMVQPIPSVPTLRDAVRVVAPRVHNRDFVTEDAAVRRIERYCRASFST